VLFPIFGIPYLHRIESCSIHRSYDPES
jgi:hypothetical protein